MNSRLLHLGGVFKSQSATAGEDWVQAENDSAISFSNIAFCPHSVGNSGQLDKLVLLGNFAIFRSASSGNEAAMFEADFDCEIERRTISARLAVADDLSQHEKLLF